MRITTGLTQSDVAGLTQTPSNHTSSSLAFTSHLLGTRLSSPEPAPCNLETAAKMGIETLDVHQPCHHTESMASAAAPVIPVLAPGTIWHRALGHFSLPVRGTFPGDRLEWQTERKFVAFRPGWGPSLETRQNSLDRWWGTLVVQGCMVKTSGFRPFVGIEYARCVHLHDPSSNKTQGLEHRGKRWGTPSNLHNKLKPAHPNRHQNPPLHLPSLWQLWPRAVPGDGGMDLTGTVWIPILRPAKKNDNGFGAYFDCLIFVCALISGTLNAVERLNVYILQLSSCILLAVFCDAPEKTYGK